MWRTQITKVPKNCCRNLKCCHDDHFLQFAYLGSSLSLHQLGLQHLCRWESLWCLDLLCDSWWAVVLITAHLFGNGICIKFRNAWLLSYVVQICMVSKRKQLSVLLDNIHRRPSINQATVLEHLLSLTLMAASQLPLFWRLVGKEKHSVKRQWQEVLVRGSTDLEAAAALSASFKARLLVCHVEILS